jgi:hypothetical protein
VDVPSSAAARTYYWRAVERLREAESLAQLGHVSGPADAPPEKPEDESGWIADWKKRAKETARKAYEALAENPTKAVKRRAAEISSRLQRGIAAIRKANPSEATKQKLSSLADLLKGLWGAAHAGTSFGTLLALAVIAWWFFGRKG